MTDFARVGPSLAFSRALRRHLANGGVVFDFSMNSQTLISPPATIARAFPLVARALARADLILVVSLLTKVFLLFDFAYLGSDFSEG